MTRTERSPHLTFVAEREQRFCYFWAILREVLAGVCLIGPFMDMIPWSRDQWIMRLPTFVLFISLFLHRYTMFITISIVTSMFRPLNIYLLLLFHVTCIFNKIIYSCTITKRFFYSTIVLALSELDCSRLSCYIFHWCFSGPSDTVTWYLHNSFFMCLSFTSSFIFSQYFGGFIIWYT